MNYLICNVNKQGSHWMVILMSLHINWLSSSLQLYVSVVSSCQLITQSRNWRWHLPGSDADLWRLSNAMYFNVILCIGIQTMPREAVTTTDNVRFWLLFMSTDNWFWFHIFHLPPKWGQLAHHQSHFQLWRFLSKNTLLFPGLGMRFEPRVIYFSMEGSYLLGILLPLFQAFFIYML